MWWGVLFCVFGGFFSLVLVQNTNVLCVTEQGVMTRMHRRKQRMPGIYGITMRFGCFRFLWIAQEGLCPEFIKDKEKLYFQESFQWALARLPSGPFLCKEPQNNK